jgi:sugar transferase (PEP-CTERM/EpsH1 system associated)
MRILFLTPQLPYPPEKGTSLRNWGLISNLAQRHQIALLSFRAPDQQADLPSELAGVARVTAVKTPGRTAAQRLLGILTTRRPDMALRLVSDGYRQALERLLEANTFDVAHVEGIEMAPYLDSLERASPRPLIVLDDHNCEYVLQRRVFLADLRTPARWPAALYSLLQWLRLRRYESQACRRADRVLAVSDADAEALLQLARGLDITVVPNGVDTRYYRPGAADVERGTGTVPELVFTGTMDFRPNVDGVLWFARRILPLVRKRIQDVHFTVVGQRPHSRLRKLAANPHVTLTGHVPDVRPFISRATVYVAPLRSGGGTRLKLLEAMAMGKAIVATTMAAQGFPVSDGRELLLADEADSYAAAIVTLLTQPERRRELGRAGRAFAERGYDWSSIVPRVEAAYGNPPRCG